MTATKANRDATTAAPDPLVPDRQFREELHVSPMSCWRYDHAVVEPPQDWPPRITFGANKRGYKRGYRFRSAIETFKKSLAQQALAERGKKRRDGKAA
jgi:hypothetical protein